MKAAQQHTVRDVGAPGIPDEMIDVMRFGPTRWAIAIREAAPTVPSRQADALPSCEQPLLAPDVHHLSVAIESDRHHAGFAGEPFDRLDRYRVVLPLDATPAFAPGERLTANVHPYGRRLHPEDRTAIGTDRDGDHLDEGVVHQLVGRTRVGDDPFDALALPRIDESRAVTPG